MVKIKAYEYLEFNRYETDVYGYLIQWFDIVYKGNLSLWKESLVASK